MHSFRAITRQHREVMHLAGRTCFHHQTGAGAQTFFDQVLVNGRQSQDRRNRHLARVDSAVADDQNIVAALDVIHRFGAH